MKKYISLLGNIVFFLGVYIEIFLMCTASANIELPLRGRIFQIAAALFIVKILLTKYSFKEYMIGVLLLALSLLQWYYAYNETYAYAVLMIFASKNIDYDKLLKSIFVILATVMAGMILLSSIGVIDRLALVQDYGRGGVETRYCFGYPHPNVFHSNFYTLVSVFVLAFAKKLNGWMIGEIVLLNVVVTCFTASRTGMIIVMVLCVLLCAACYLKPILEKRWVQILGIVSILTACVGSVIVLVWENPLTDKLNEMLTGRIMLARMFAMPETWTFLPNTIDRDVLDMGYIQLYATSGVLLATVYMAAMILFYAGLWKKKDAIAMAVVLSYAVFMLVEGHATSMYFIGNIMYLTMLGRVFRDTKNRIVDTENNNIVK